MFKSAGLTINTELNNEDQIIVFRNNQRYDQIGTEPDVRRDGTKTKLLIFESACAVCQRLFTATTTKIMLANFGRLNRRCKRCISLRKRIPLNGKKL